MSNNIIKSILELDDESWKYPSRFKSFLMDLDPEDKITRHIIMVSVEEKIPDELIDKNIITQFDSNKLIKRIISSSGCELLHAQKVLNLWLEAFDISSETLIEDILFYPIDKLNLRWDLIDKLNLANIDTIRELCTYSKEELLSINGIGKWFLKNVINALNEFGLSLRPENETEILYGYPSVVTKYDKESNKSWAHKLFMNMFKYNYECFSKFRKIVDEMDIKKGSYILYQNYEIKAESEYILEKIQNIVDCLSDDFNHNSITAISDSEKSGNPLFVAKYVEACFINLKKLISIKKYIRGCSVSDRFERSFKTLIDFVDEIVDCFNDAYDGIVDALNRIELMEYASANDSIDKRKINVKTTFDIQVPVNITTDNLKKFGQELELAYSLPVDVVHNKKTDIDMSAVFLAFRKKNEKEKKEENEEFISTLPDKLINSSKKIVDSSGVRWFKCKYCNLIAKNHYFIQKNYNYYMNLHICKYCYEEHKDNIDSEDNNSFDPELDLGPVSKTFPMVINDTCPFCGAQLCERQGKYGRFIGCTKFPKCRYTRNIKKIRD